jgi:hypothetical protein
MVPMTNNGNEHRDTKYGYKVSTIHSPVAVHEIWTSYGQLGSIYLSIYLDSLFIIAVSSDFLTELLTTMIEEAGLFYLHT